MLRDPFTALGRACPRAGKLQVGALGQAASSFYGETPAKPVKGGFHLDALWCPFWSPKRCRANPRQSILVKHSFHKIGPDEKPLPTPPSSSGYRTSQLCLRLQPAIGWGGQSRGRHLAGAPTRFRRLAIEGLGNIARCHSWVCDNRFRL
jgi:hypothetical protein